MMKITLFVLAALLIAVVVASPRPDAPEEASKLPNMEDILKTLQSAYGDLENKFKELATKENMDKLQETALETGNKIKTAVEELLAKSKDTA